MRIDGKDLRAGYGCTLLEGSFDTLLKYPKRKAVKYRNWAETDGIDPDLSVVEFEARKVKLSFLMESEGEAGFWRQYRRLTADLSAPGYRSFDLFPGLTTRLRLDTGASFELPVPLNAGKNASSFDLSFVEDVPLITPAAYPVGGITLRGQMAINGIDFGAFGIGSDDELEDILKTPAMKAPFTDGRAVDLSTIKVQHREIKLSLWMLAGSPEEFLNNYRAFFAQLTGPDTQELYIKTLESTLQVYYSDCPSYKIEIWRENDVMVRFTLSLVIPVISWVDAGGDVRYTVLVDRELGILADEEGRIIVFD